MTVTGFWFAIEDATLENGCLWAKPGGHRTALRKVFKRAGDTDDDGTLFEELDPHPAAVAVRTGAARGAGRHAWSCSTACFRTGATSTAPSVSRHAYSLHCISAAADYPEWNWLQRPADMPLRSLAESRSPHEHPARLPKALLHDHLDGGLRPATVIELADEYGYTKLPTTDVDELAAVVQPRRQAQRPRAVPRDVRPHRRRHAAPRRDRAGVATSAPQDLAADGVVYAEVRFAPELCTEAGPHARRGGRGGARRLPHAAPPAPTSRSTLICSAMRTAARSREIAELAVRWRDAGVVGFDIAGAEAGFPPTRHLDAFQYVRRENFHSTIHAGEAFGLPSIWEAVQFCGAERLGHGVRIVDDITGPPGDEKLGRLAAYVRDRRIPLELCPTSNVSTGVCRPIAEHPIGMLRRLRFRVTVNTDNRLMSATSMTQRDGATRTRRSAGASTTSSGSRSTR